MNDIGLLSCPCYSDMRLAQLVTGLTTPCCSHNCSSIRLTPSSASSREQTSRFSTGYIAGTILGEDDAPLESLGRHDEEVKSILISMGYTSDSEPSISDRYASERHVFERFISGSLLDAAILAFSNGKYDSYFLFGMNSSTTNPFCFVGSTRNALNMNGSEPTLILFFFSINPGVCNLNPDLNPACRI